MPSAAFLAAAKAGNRKPVALMSIESADALVREYSTQSDWAGSSLLTNISTSEIPGAAVVASESSSLWSYDWPYGIEYNGLRCSGIVTPSNSMLWSVECGVYWPQSFGAGVVMQMQIFAGFNPETATLRGSSEPVSLTGVLQSQFFYPEYLHSEPVRFTFKQEKIELLAGEKIYFTSSIDAIYGLGVLTIGGSTGWYRDSEGRNTSTHIATTLPLICSYLQDNATLTTSTIDLGETPAAAARVNIDDIIPANTTLVYNAWAGDTDPPTVDLGPVSDGDTLGAIGYRYYRFDADFAATGGDRAELHEIRILGGDSQFDHFGTHIDQPFIGVKPYLTESSFGAVSSKVELTKAATTGDVSVKMLWTRETSDLLAAGYLRGKLVELSIGFDGLAQSEFEPLGLYTWHDYSADPNNLTINVKLRDVFKQFEKVKIPTETLPDGTGARTLVPLTWTSINIIQVILDIFDAVGIPDRLLDRAAFVTLRDGVFSGTDWQVTRELNDPKESGDLLNELRVTAGLFLVPQRNGKLTPVVYDPTATEVGNLDAREVEFGTISGGQKDLYTRQIIYYSAKAGVVDPSSEKDFDKVYIDIDATAEADWNVEAQQVWLDKWSASLPAITAIATRFNGWFAEPMLRLSAKNVPLSLMGVQNGELITVDNLLLPQVSASWPQLSKGRKFLVLSNSFDPQNYTVSLDLYDTGLIGGVGPGAVASDISLAGPTSIWGATNLFIVSGGDAPFTWATTAGTITDLGGGTVSLDVTDLSGSGSITVSDATGKATIRFNIIQPQILAGTILDNITNAFGEAAAVIVPADLTSSIQAHFDANNWDSVQDQLDDNLPIYLQPSTDGSVYIETFDLGQPLPAGTMARAEIGVSMIAGSITTVPLIEMSTDGVTYNGTSGDWIAPVGGYRYLRLRLDINSNNNSTLARISGVRIYLTEE